MKRWISLLTMAVLITAMLVGCSGNGSGNRNDNSDSNGIYEIHLATLSGPTGLGMSFMLDEEDTENRYTYTVASSPDEVTGKLLTGAYDIAALPTNVAATLYNGSDGKIRLLALNTLGVLYVLENGDTIRSIKDLRGKTVYISGQGSTPEYLVKYLLSANGIDPENDVTLDFTYSAHADLATFAASGAADVVLLPEPVATSLLSQNTKMRVALNLNDVWEKTVKGTDAETSKITMGCVAVNADFAKKNPEAIRRFLNDYRSSVEKVKSDPEAASVQAEKLGIVAKAALAQKALPRCNITFVTGKEMQKTVEPFYRVLMEFNAKSVGGKLPAKEFYYGG